TPRPRLGFLGLGWIGRSRMRGLAAAGLADIVAVADVLPDATRAAAEESGPGCQACTPGDLLDMELDGLVIATPSAMHAAQAIAALERGLAVFCQKPLGRNLAEVTAVVDTARRK